jgi:CubicO group peptidase (beta-lactamase class C family)
MRLFLFFVTATTCASIDPGNGPWSTASPEEQNIDQAKLNEAIEYAMSRRGGSKSHCVSVHRNGLLVGEAYADDTQLTDSHIVWSTSKAVTSTLVGIAEKAGSLDAMDAASVYIPEWNTTFGSPLQPDTRGILVDMLLRHDSGRYYDGITDFVRPQLQPSQTDFAIGLRQQHEPGTKYQYN